MTVGDIGVAIVVDSGGFNMTGSTAKLLAAPGSEPNPVGGAIPLAPLTIAPNGLTGTYMTTGKDFQEGGPWQLQLQVATPDGQIFTSPWGAIYVNPLL